MAIMLRVMVTQEWSWFYGQLDHAKSHRIKAHILYGDSSRSFCGLLNVTDEGEMTLEDYDGPDACKKCLRAYNKWSKQRERT